MIHHILRQTDRSDYAAFAAAGVTGVVSWANFNSVMTGICAVLTAILLTMRIVKGVRDWKTKNWKDDEL